MEMAENSMYWSDKTEWGEYSDSNLHTGRNNNQR